MTSRTIQLAGFPSRPVALEWRDRYAKALCAIKAQHVFGVHVKWAGKAAGWSVYLGRHPGVTGADVAEAKEHLAWYLRLFPDEPRRQDCQRKATYPDLAIAFREAEMVRRRWRYTVWPYPCDTCEQYHLTSDMPDSASA